MTNPHEAAMLITGLHERFCDELDELMRSFSAQLPTPDRPECRLSLKSARWAGYYWWRPNCCWYSIPHACTVGGDSYTNTVAHEVCHAYASQLHRGSAWHGETWQLLMRHLGHEPQRTVTVDMKLVRKVGNLLWARYRGAARGSMRQVEDPLMLKGGSDVNSQSKDR